MLAYCVLLACLIPSAQVPAKEPVVTAWTGRELIVWGDRERRSDVREGVASDPLSGRVRSLPRAPFALNQATAAWTGTELVVVGANLDGRNRSRSPHAQGMAYDPAADRWRVIRPYPLSPQASSVVWTGRELLAWDYLLRSAAYDPESDRWRRLPDVPLRDGECYPESARAGGVILASYCGKHALFDIATSSWRSYRSP